MNLVVHHRSQSIIHEAMTRQTGESGETWADDFDAEMAAFGVESSVPGVGGGIVGDLERIG